MGTTKSKQKEQINKISEDLRNLNVESKKLNKTVQAVQSKNDALEKHVKDIRDENKIVRKKVEEQSVELERWKRFSSALKKKYDEQSKYVQTLIAKNRSLQEKLEEELNMSLLERIKLAIDADPMFEDEIRGMLSETPQIKTDFQRLFLASADVGYSDESGLESDGCSRVESDGPTVESDSCGGRTEADGENDSAYFESDVESIDDESLESGVAIAYVLSKMYCKNAE